MTNPRPAKSARATGTGRPLAAALDLLGRRWSLRILWELRDATLGARELRRRCDDVSPDVLYRRLRELADAGLVTGGEEGYQLTRSGSSLSEAMAPLDGWSKRWARTNAGQATIG